MPSTTYFHKLGLGAQLVSLKFGMLQALLLGQVYHMPTSHYVNPVRCPSRSFNCYFEPASSCTVESHLNLTKDEHHWCADLPRRQLTELAGLETVHSSSWYHAQLASYLFRPNEALLNFRADVLANLASSEPPVPSPLPTATTAPKPDGSSYRGEHDGACVALHVRRTDKHTEDKTLQGGRRGFEGFARQLKSWEHWSYRHPAVPLHAFLGSEDNETFAVLPKLIWPMVVRWIPSSYFVLDSNTSNAFKTIGGGNHRMTEIYKLKLQKHRERQTARQVARKQLAEQRVSSLKPEALEADGLAAELLSRLARLGHVTHAHGHAAAEDERTAESHPKTEAEVQHELEHDEGMALILQIVLMSECEAFIGSYSSNIAVLVHDLMMARRVLQERPLHVLDVDGRIYCGCGASFCMELEESLNSHPATSVRRLINADSFSHRAASVAPNPLAEAP